MSTATASPTPGTAAAAAGAGRRRGATVGERATEAAIVVLGLVTVLGFCRVFVGWSFAAPLSLAVVSSSVLAVLARRRGWGIVVSGLLSAAGLVVFTTLAFYGDTARWFIPTSLTREALRVDLDAAWSVFPTTPAPAEPLVGFLVVAAAALWIAAFLADGFAFRAAVGLETVVPYGVLFAFCSAVSAERYRLLMVGLWLVAAAVVVALHRSMRQEASGWLSGHRHGVAEAALRVGGLMGVVAVVGALVLGPSLPGVGGQPLIDPTTGGSGTRTTVSPLVDIRGRLSERSDRVAFTVEADRASYWRLTALDTFDGRIWSSTRDYGDAAGRLGGGLPTELTVPVEQQVTIESLDSVWMPAAFTPQRIETDQAVRYDPDTASLVTRRGSVDSGTTYRVVSAVPRLQPGDLTASGGPDARQVSPRYLELPPDYSPAYRQLARRITEGATTTYDQALRLQSWFRDNFTYDLDVPSGHSEEAIADFLERRRGYCEQFAGTFAAFARSLGIPSRVAVGFTPGERDAEGRFVVKGKHAHAWPEVHLADIGWVAFEPTPSRGAPGAEDYTGVAAAQEGEQPTTPAPSQSTTTVAGQSPSTTISSAEAVDDLLAGLGIGDLGSSAGADSGGADRPWLRPLVVVVVAVALAALWVLATPRVRRARWDRRQATATTSAERVLVAWHRTAEALDRVGAGPAPSETPLEHARRAAQATRFDARQLTRLAEHVTVAAYAAGDAHPALAIEADEIRRAIEHRISERASVWQRLRWAADPTQLVRPLPATTIAEATPTHSDRDLEPVG